MNGRYSRNPEIRKKIVTPTFRCMSSRGAGTVPAEAKTET
jgi:hypothetical protein